MARSIEYGYNPNIGLNGLVSVKMLDTVFDYGRIIECIMQFRQDKLIIEYYVYYYRWLKSVCQFS